MSKFDVVTPCWISLALLLCCAPLTFAKIPEPPHIFYGTVTVNGKLLKATDTQVTITIKRSTTVLDAYTMGEIPAAGDQYVLRVPLDAVEPQAPNTARSGQQANIYVGNQLATQVTLGPRGRITPLRLVVGTQPPPDVPGDADGDGVLETSNIQGGDIAALIAGIFSANGPVVNVQNDANADGLVDAADIACAVLLAAQGAGSCTGNTTGTATLAVAQEVLAKPNALVTVPLTLTTQGAQGSSLVFSIDYNETLLTLDPRDNDHDGIPDAIDVRLPGYQAAVSFNATDTDGEIDIVLADLDVPLEAFANGLLVSLSFQTAAVTRTTAAAVRFSQTPSASFGSTKGTRIPLATMDGYVVIGQPLDVGTFVGTTGTQLIEIDPNTGAGSLRALQTPSDVVLDLAFRDTGILFGTTTAAGVHRLNVINPFTGEVRRIGSDQTGAIEGLVFARTLLYGVVTTVNGTSELVTLDPTTGDALSVGLTGFGPLGALAYEAQTQRLYGVTAHSAGSQLITLNRTTGVGTVVGPVVAGSTPVGRVTALAFASDGTLFGGVGTGSPLAGKVLIIDPRTGAATVVGSTGFPALRGLTFVPKQVFPCPYDGDVNHDGTLTPLDALLVFRNVMGLATMSFCQQQHANVEEPQHPAVTMTDAMCIFQKSLGLPSCLD